MRNGTLKIETDAKIPVKGSRNAHVLFYECGEIYDILFLSSSCYHKFIIVLIIVVDGCDYERNPYDQRRLGRNDKQGR